jgi:hypothetical protein
MSVNRYHWRAVGICYYGACCLGAFSLRPDLDKNCLLHFAWNFALAVQRKRQGSEAARHGLTTRRRLLLTGASLIIAYMLCDMKRDFEKKREELQMAVLSGGVGKDGPVDQAGKRGGTGPRE